MATENIISNNNNEEKWESFLEDLATGYPEVCDLTDSSLHGITYDENDSEQMRMYRQRILQSIEGNPAPLPWVMLGNKFLSLASTTEQRQLYDVILRSKGLSDLALGSPRRQTVINNTNRNNNEEEEPLNADVVSIHEMLKSLLANGIHLRFTDYLCIHTTRIEGGIETNMLAEAVASISIWNTFEAGIVTFTQPSQVKEFSRILKEEGFLLKGYHLQNLCFNVKVEYPGEDDDTLDPLIIALSKSNNMNTITLNVIATRTGDNNKERNRRRSLVSPTAFKALLGSKVVSKIDLFGLNLDDRHCKEIKEAIISKRFKSQYLCLKTNPTITMSDYNTLVRAVSCDYHEHRHHCPRVILVDDLYGESQIQFVFDMDVKGRHKYVEQGAFVSRRMWIEWLMEVTRMETSRIPIESLENMKVGYIFHALLERPDFLLTI